MATTVRDSLADSENEKMKEVFDGFQVGSQAQTLLDVPDLNQLSIHFRGEEYRGFDRASAPAWKNLLETAEKERQFLLAHQVEQDKLEREMKALKGEVQSASDTAEENKAALEKLKIDSESKESDRIVELIERASARRPGLAIKLQERGLIDGINTKRDVKKAYDVSKMTNDSVLHMRKSMQSLEKKIPKLDVGPWSKRLNELSDDVDELARKYIDQEKELELSKKKVSTLEKEKQTSAAAVKKLQLDLTQANSSLDVANKFGNDLQREVDDSAVLSKTMQKTFDERGSDLEKRGKDVKRLEEELAGLKLSSGNETHVRTKLESDLGEAKSNIGTLE